jgi:phosphopantothenoylcysteine decarboxylase/phosphopantothenate--cysteine ligase
VGKGRLAEPETIVAAALALVARSRALAGRRILVTAGPTLEDLDPVRFIGNRSSGRMGYAIAGELTARGASVTLVTGPTSLVATAAKTVQVRSAAQMHDAVMAEIGTADALVMAAAVANYAPEQVADRKIAHQDGTLTLSLAPTRDILADVAAWRRQQQRQRPLLIGFAAETDDVVERARAKRAKKGIDVIIANDVSSRHSGFDVDANEVTIIGAGGDEHVPRASKAVIASALADRLERWLAVAATAGAHA